MAAYAQTAGFLKSLKLRMEIFNGVNNEIVINQILVLINTEYAAMASAGLGAYTVTTGLEATMEEKMGNFSNDISRQEMKNWIEKLLVEFALVETNGLSYTQSASFQRKLNETIDNLPNSTHREIFRRMNVIINTENVALVAAS